MKRTLVFLVMLAALIAHSSPAATRTEQWGKVQLAIGKGLPKSAVAELEPIIAGAIGDKAYAEAVKAVGLKIALEGNIEGNKPEEKILRLQAELAKYPAEMQRPMEAILAHWYWQYFLHNRWRFLQRTQTAAAPGPDLQTWDLPRILAEIDKHFTAALADEDKLKATPVTAYDDLLTKGALPDQYRPTMFDFLAHEALQFYSAGEQGAAKAEDAFVLDAASPIFAPVPDFLKWQPDTGDDTSPTLKAIRLYQKLLAFHLDDQDRTAFADADLWRLVFGHNKAVGEDKDERYLAALKRFVNEWSKHEVSARALAEWAGVIHRQGDLVEARQLAQRGVGAFPNSVGGAMCFNLIAQIEARSASIQTERVWDRGANPKDDGRKQDACATLNVSYRNVTKVYFRAVPYNFESFLKSQRWNWYNFNDKFRQELLSRRADLEWNADLPPTPDYRERTERLPAPTDLKPGFYFIIASHSPSFDQRENQVSVAPVWITELALVLRARPYDKAYDGLVLQARTGEPVAGATVRSWKRDREGWWQPSEQAQTDANGLFRFESPVNYEPRLFLVEHDGQQVSSANELWAGQGSAEANGEQTMFFTDRALYRPGQTIYYKGIHVLFHQSGNDYSTIAGRQITVEFLDPNGKEIARATHVSNDYGSFDGTFTAPRDRVMGQMMIRHANVGATSFGVEEYKRPKFQVELPAPKEAAKLNTETVLTGKATAYTGAAIGGAKVNWRVMREIRYPYWCWWARFWPRFGESQAIAHGTAVTEADGSFTVKFTAKPDLSVPEKDEPVFQFTVHADVIDTTGETRSAERVVRAGYTALQATATADEWQTPAHPVEIKIDTQTLDGEPQSVEGVVKVYRLKQPAQVARTDLFPVWQRRLASASRQRSGETPLPLDPADPNTWELGDLMSKESFKTDAKGLAKLGVTLPAGIYRGMLETKDRFGKSVTARLPVQVVDPKARRFTVKLPNHFAAAKWEVEPGQPFLALWGTGYDRGRAYVELECRGKLLRGYWTAANRTQEAIEQAVTEEMRGGFTLRVTYVRENRAYLNERIVNVPWSNKELTVKWEHFTSKLAPGQKETWSVRIEPGRNGVTEKWHTGKPVVPNTPSLQHSNTPAVSPAEFVAALYDASLDQYLPHLWPSAFSVFRHEVDRVNARFENSALPFQHIWGWWQVPSRGVDLRYRAFPPEIVANLWGYGYFGGFGYVSNGARGPGGRPMRKMAQSESVNGFLGDAPMVMATPSPAESGVARDEAAAESLGGMKHKGLVEQELSAAPGLDLSQVVARKNLAETAFFFPHLLADSNGVVRIEFSMPEALTEWKFLGFAHDTTLRAGFLTDKTVTAKDLMVEPNPPRFVREGDTIEFTVKVSNQSADRQTGKIRLTLADARTLASMDAALGNAKPELEFDVPAKESRSFSWRLTVPDGCEFLTYKAVGATAKLSDGEEGFLPVLSRRILVTESLPLPIRGKQTKNFEFTRLLESGKSDTLRSQSLTVQMVSQPAWYAVMALPYLMEYPYECSEQTFNRLYANSLARHIANSDPKIRRIFDLWKNTPALDSPLEKNQDLKSVMLEETPWYRQAMDESQARRNVGILFDANRLDEETARMLHKLSEMQLSEGLWPWFPGGPPSEYISLYIMTGFGRLRHLGVDLDVSAAVRSLGTLDHWVDEQYRWILKHSDKDLNHLNYTIAFYLYGRSFFLKDQPIAKENREAVDYWLGQGRRYWLELNCRQSQAHLAIGLKRFGDEETPVAIMKSIKERSVANEELGMFWRDLELSWWWYRAPIETQAMMIEAFSEVMHDAAAAEDCKVWLLKQKQTQDWKTTKATADAIYGLLLGGEASPAVRWSPDPAQTPTPLPRGLRLLSSDALVEVALGGEWIKPEKVEAGTGFYEEKFARGEIKPAMGHITVKKVDDGVSWGSVHWQYLEDMTKVTPYEGTPLKLKKTLFIKETTKKGQVLRPVTGALHVGEELVVRIELRTDRDIEYVHLKDQRGSGTEPVNVLSRYKFQDGLAYYESTRDTASHFFIDYLPKGVYVFEYSTRIQLKGRYQTGVAEIQCMYAPEFNSHSESFALEVK